MKVEEFAIATNGEKRLLRILHFLFPVRDIGLANGEERFLEESEFFSNEWIKIKNLLFFVFVNIKTSELQSVACEVFKKEGFHLFDEFPFELLHLGRKNFKRRNDRKIEIR